ncbi:hypothetical protein HHK36_032551 [Tetracentron sinense]|uniref:Uncharacterized protein n=1 Tax=Tetracentron sinense TaxID=13715 RepID=A0A835CXK5_TETSI|nr:hypothetical protein HHK36_032551 [Tetracentron sinense]
MRSGVLVHDRRWNITGDLIISDVQDAEVLEFSNFIRNRAGDSVSNEIKDSEIEACCRKSFQVIVQLLLGLAFCMSAALSVAGEFLSIHPDFDENRFGFFCP